MFDFQKAINGEPIYLDGSIIYPEYNPSQSVWKYARKIYDKNGLPYDNIYKLSTDPPKKKVMVTAYVYRNLNGDIIFHKHKTIGCIGEISGEVEI